MTWPGITVACNAYTKSCKICQIQKKNKVNYGELPPKNVTDKPWTVLCIDLIGPYTVLMNKEKLITLQAMTFIDPATGWFEIAEVKNKTSANISQLLDTVWLSRYPRPQRVVMDNGSEFKKDFLPILKEYGIKPSKTSIKNPRANGVLERLHQVISNMLRCMDLPNMMLNPEDPWTSVLASVAYSIRCAHHRGLQASPAQLVYGRDMILPITHHVEWDLLSKRRQQLVDKNNKNENKHRIHLDYKLEDKIMIINQDIQRKMDAPNEGPYKIIQVHVNGTVTIQRGSVQQRLNIRRVKPYNTP